MKRNFALTGLMLAVCALAVAQENTPGRIVVPARNGSRTRTLEANIMSGPITIHGGSGTVIVIEAAPGAEGRRALVQPKGTEGMHRIDSPLYSPVQVEESGDVVHLSVMAGSMTGRGLTVTVPSNTALNITCLHGEIKVDGINGSLALSDTNGGIDLTNVSGTVLANTTQGSIKAVLDRIGDKPLSFVTMNGNVDLTLPADTKASFKMKTMHGDIWSDFDMKVSGNGGGVITRGTAGHARMEFDRTITGAINGGGTEIMMSTFNGRLLIHKK
jgi:hypothetical protein